MSAGGGGVAEEGCGGSTGFGRIGAGGDVGEGADSTGSGVGCDGLRATGVGALEARNPLDCLGAFEPGEELVEGEVVSLGDGEEWELGGEVVGEEVVEDGVRGHQGLGIRQQVGFGLGVLLGQSHGPVLVGGGAASRG